MSSPASRQLTMTQPTLSASAPPARQTPRTMKKAIDFRRPPDVMVQHQDSTRPWQGRYRERRLVPIGDRRSARRRPLLRRLADFGGPHVPDEPDRAEQLQREPGEVELVPGKAVARRGRMGVMVVVPAFAEREERHPPAGFGNRPSVAKRRPPHMCVAELTSQVACRPTTTRRKIAQFTSGQPPIASSDEAEHRQRHPVIGRQPAVERVLAEVGRVARHARGVVVLRLAEDDPADVRPEPADARRVRVVRLVGVLMVQAVGGDPEDRSAFERQRAADRQEVFERTCTS